MLFLVKYWRYIALVAAIVAVFVWHKAECSKAANEAVAIERAAVAMETEKLRKEMQAAIIKAESRAAEVVTVVDTKIKVVDREVIKKVFVECPDAFSEYKRLLNEYVKAGSAEAGN